MSLVQCPECAAEVSSRADACPSCGCPLRVRPQPVVVQVPPSDGGLAVATLLCYIFLYPVGFVLNLVGLFSAPRKGCFLWMLLVFVGLPLVVLVALLLFGLIAADSQGTPYR